jgi:hypothetical protein
MILATGLFLLTATVALNGWAQAPGGGQGGRGGGRGGFGGGTRGWGGDSLLSLATRSAVQDDLKVSDKQKGQINSLNEDYNLRRQKLFEGMRQQNGGTNGRRGGNRQNNNNVAPNNGGVGANGLTNAAGGNPYTRGYDVNPFALNVPQQQPNQQPQNGQQDERRARSQAMRDGMAELDQQANITLARILPGKQFRRLNQIQIQSQGLNALVRPDVAETIRINETQVEAIKAVISDRRSAQREVFTKQGQVFRTFFQNQNRGAANGKAQAGDTAKADAGGAPGTATANANDGGNRRRGGFDREAMKKFMEQPEVKAQREQAQTATEKIDQKATQAAYKILTKYQLAAYKKLQGPPFDVSKLRPNFGGTPGGNRDTNTTPADKAANGATPEKTGSAPGSASTNVEPKKTTTAKAKSKTKSKRTYRQYQDF